MNIIPMIPLSPRHGLRGLRDEKERLRTGHRVPCEMAREDLRLAQAWPSNALSAVATKLRKENIRRIIVSWEGRAITIIAEDMWMTNV